MSEDVVDLDVLVPADKHVRIGGREFPIPGNLPLVTYLKFNRYAGEQEKENGASESEILTGMVDALVELFGWRLKQDDFDTFAFLRYHIERWDLDTILSVVSQIYPSVDEEEPAESGGVVDADATVPPESTEPPSGAAPTPTTK